MSTTTIDKNTYGKNPAEESLAKILSEINKPQLTAYVGKKLANVNILVKSIKDIPKHDKLDIPGYLYTLLKRDFFADIESSQHIQENAEIESYVKNCVVIRLKELVA